MINSKTSDLDDGKETLQVKFIKRDIFIKQILRI